MPTPALANGPTAIAAATPIARAEARTEAIGVPGRPSAKASPTATLPAPLDR